MGYLTNRFFKHLLQISSAVVGSAFLISCATAPDKVLIHYSNSDARQELERQANTIVHWSTEIDRTKPDLLLLHGATDEPSEMIDIALAWEDTYNVFFFSYNYHQPVQKIADAFAAEVKKLKSQNRLAGNMTIVAYSYAAIVVRAAVVSTEDTAVFSGASLIQLVPLAGGSHLARWLRFPLIKAMVFSASKQSVASNPYSRFAKEIWNGKGNEKFYEVIRPERMHSILLEGDAHSLEHAAEEEIRAHYQNGIGSNVTVIPESAGVSHDYFTTEPTALSYLQQILEMHSENLAINSAPTNRLEADAFETSLSNP